MSAHQILQGTLVCISPLFSIHVSCHSLLWTEAKCQRRDYKVWLTKTPQSVCGNRTEDISQCSSSSSLANVSSESQRGGIIAAAMLQLAYLNLFICAFLHTVCVKTFELWGKNCSACITLSMHTATPQVDTLISFISLKPWDLESLQAVELHTLLMRRYDTYLTSISLFPSSVGLCLRQEQRPWLLILFSRAKQSSV